MDRQAGPANPFTEENPLKDWAIRPNARLVAVRPVWPKPLTRSMISPGLIERECRIVQPPAFHGAGGEVLDEDVGRAAPASAAHRGRSAHAGPGRWNVFRGALIFHHSGAPECDPSLRIGSPTRGCSIFDDIGSPVRQIGADHRARDELAHIGALSVPVADRVPRFGGSASSSYLFRREYHWDGPHSKATIIPSAG